MLFCCGILEYSKEADSTQHKIKHCWWSLRVQDLLSNGKESSTGNSDVNVTFYSRETVPKILSLHSFQM